MVIGNLPTELVTHCPSWFGCAVVTKRNEGSCSTIINSDQVWEVTISVNRTRNKMRVAIESGTGMKVKVVKLC